jgi:hypothetical protein
LARGSALLDDRGVVNESDLHMVCRAALDSLPVPRRTVLVAMTEGQNPYGVGLPATTIYRALDDLQAVGLVQGVRTSGQTADLTEQAIALIKGTGLFSAITVR